MGYPYRNEKVIVDAYDLVVIADFIRYKLGEETNPHAVGFTKYNTQEMGNKVSQLPFAKDAIPNGAKIIRGDCDYRFANGGWDWFIEQLGEEITTEEIINCDGMFHECHTLTRIPFDINSKAGLPNLSLDGMFYGCYNLTELPKIVGKAGSMRNLFLGCKKLEYIPEKFYKDIDWGGFDNSSVNGTKNSMFRDCHALRSVPSELLKHNVKDTSIYGSYLYNGFIRCYALDELRDLPLSFIVKGWTNNGFYSTFEECYRLKAVTFELNGGQPLVLNLKNQTIHLTYYLGYASGESYIPNYTYLTKETYIKDDATYQALKNNPDSWTCFPQYSRYNHDSAVETINSLPDTSAYLAANGGTNTIVFKGDAGSATDGGAVNTLTEAEIAVAAAKGWTVSLV